MSHAGKPPPNDNQKRAPPPNPPQNPATNPQPVQPENPQKFRPSFSHIFINDATGVKPPESENPDKPPTIINVEHEQAAQKPKNLENEPNSLSNPKHDPKGFKKKGDSGEFHSPGHSDELILKPIQKKSSRDDFVFLSPPHEGELPVKAWPMKDKDPADGFHTPPGGEGAVTVNEQRKKSRSSLRKGSLLYSSDDEHLGLSSLSKPTSNEKEPLLSSSANAQEILDRMMAMDRVANRFDDFNVHNNHFTRFHLNCNFVLSH